MSWRQGITFLAGAALVLGIAAAFTPRYEAPEKVSVAVERTLAQCSSDADCEARFGIDRHELPSSQCAEDDPCWDCRTMGNRICGRPQD